jgi:hypothetical protein
MRWARESLCFEAVIGDMQRKIFFETTCLWNTDNRIGWPIPVRILV